MKESFGEIIGKTVECVIVSDRNSVGPLTQVYLLFTDGTSLELFGDVQAGKLERGDQEAVLNYVRKSGGTIRQYPG